MPANQHHTANARKSAPRPRKPAPPRAIPAAARPLLSAKTAARMAEMDAALDTAPGHGVAETLLDDLIGDVTGGEFPVFLEGWNWENPDRAAAALDRLGERWRREDSGEAAAGPGRAAAAPSAAGRPAVSAGQSRELVKFADILEIPAGEFLSWILADLLRDFRDPQNGLLLAWAERQTEYRTPRQAERVRERAAAWLKRREARMARRHGKGGRAS